jgi:hypothetical protein
MSKKIKIDEIYDKNINFIFGSGTSADFIPTLKLEIKDKDNEEALSIETLATKFEDSDKKKLRTLLFMYYYKKCIKPAMESTQKNNDSGENEVLENYKNFLKNLLEIIKRRRSNLAQKCNIFTTNYDGFFTYAAEDLLENNDFVMNDGSHGFKKRVLNSRNFNKKIIRTGVFDRHEQELMQINLIHLHGSIHWYKDNNNKDNDNIEIDYNIERNKNREIEICEEDTKNFSNILESPDKNITDAEDFSPDFQDIKSEAFWDGYNSLPIVNPTKNKFHETVFEEHYYQMLRYLSYELEKPNSILIVFGFSFKDEHIKNLVKRSLSNPELHVYICCYDQKEKGVFEGFFNEFDNVEYIVREDCKDDEFLDFSYFNENVFTTKPVSETSPKNQEVSGQ